VRVRELVPAGYGTLFINTGGAQILVIEPDGRQRFIVGAEGLARTWTDYQGHSLQPFRPFLVK